MPATTLAFKVGIFILYTFTHVHDGTATNTQEYNSQTACNTAINIITNKWYAEKKANPSKILPELQMMVCVPKS